MDYPGNPSLSQETKDRITSTFSQTLDLAKEGRRREAVLGCDFILKMDPLFQPARTLQERLQTGDGPVETGDLEAAAIPPPQPGGFETSHLSTDQVGNLASPATPQASLSSEGLPSLAAAPEVPALNLDPVQAPPPAPAPPPAAPVAPPAPAAPEAPSSRSASSPDTGARIQELLDEGQVAFESAEYQKAIDAWSRIFLIDIDHQEAARRIETARKLKAELERLVDETFHEAVSHKDAGRADQARQGFERILQMQPHHLGAKEQLQQLDGGAGPGAAAPPPPLASAVPSSPATPAASPPPPSPSFADLAPAEGAPAAGAVADSAPAADPLLPELPPLDSGGSAGSSPGGDVYDGGGGTFDSFAEEAPFEAPSPAIDAKPVKQRSSFLPGVLVLLLAAGGGWLLYSRWGSFFPNADDTGPAPPPVVDVVQRATRLHLAGETANALEELQRLTPDDPAYDRAQVLIGQWSSEVEPADEEVVIDEEPHERDSRRDSLLARARQAYNEREYLASAKAFKAADDISPLEGPVADLYRDTRSQLRPIASQLQLFREREWEMVLPMLWRKLEDDPDNKDAKRILADSYFNLGVRELRRGAPDKALARFEEATKLLEEDEMTLRLLHFSQAYGTTSRDVLYDIYVRQLRFRR